MAAPPPPAGSTKPNSMFAATTANASSAPAPPAKSVSYDLSEVITVLVGPAEEAVTVQKGVICAHSVSLKYPCSQRWTKGQGGIIKLPVHDKDTFTSNVHWIHFKTANFELERTDKGDAAPAGQHRIFQLRVLGQYLLDLDFRN